MIDATDSNKKLYCIWLARVERRPRRPTSVPRKAEPVKPLEPLLLTRGEAAIYLEALNSPLLDDFRGLWGIALEAEVWCGSAPLGGGRKRPLARAHKGGRASVKSRIFSELSNFGPLRA